ncbi:hypothetical protein KIH74_13585 [Kineosporia sp. J2-2]|uniref:Uncharacterized protein n=1 Tax=Kineosporia corallincola TaxID=2835133 RepID=A0ABS5THU1_9ACTN|nr:hypothetical protein [Kineosporia corallincola]MBT0769964.1 hypothetical protein [Kineosporia corallincola]
MPQSWDDVLKEIAAADGTLTPDPDVPLRWLITRYSDTVLEPPTVLELATHDAFDQYLAGIESEDPEHAHVYAERGVDNVAVDALEMALASFLGPRRRPLRLVMTDQGLIPHDRLPDPLAAIDPSMKENLHWIAPPRE